MERTSSWLWLYLPLGLIVLLYAVAALAPQVYQDWIIPEDGVIEWATPALLLLAIVIAARLIRRPLAPRVWLALFIAGCLYFAGEEVSWGQRIFGWATPESWRAINKQEELNIHNVSALFDSKPRLLFSLGVLFGGILYPLSPRARRVLNRLFPAKLWPSYICVPAAVLALAAGLPEHIAALFTATPPPWLVLPEPGEVKELYLAMFLVFYAAGLRETA